MENSFLKTKERGVTTNYLNECFEYKHWSLYWKNRPCHHFTARKTYLSWNTQFAGKPAGSLHRCKNGDYLRVGLSFNGKLGLFLVHRVIWAICKGVWPKDQIDHIDGNGLNNNIDNLRDVPNKENARNQRKHKHNTSGVTGVSWYSTWSLWLSYGGGHSSGNFEYIGCNKNFFEAVCLRKSWESKNNYHENHGRAQ